jgi:acetoin utilization deacetylase AcuC-like enzyme
MAAIERALAARGGLGWERRASPAAERGTLEAVHAASYLDELEALAAGGGGLIDMDTRMSAGSWAAAVHGAGGAVSAVDLVLAGEAPVAASGHRPPGHHAESARGMGFCLVNNIAVAAQHALDAHGLERVLILDWDVHHGNGTNDIFHSTDRVLFASVHQSPLYPGTGWAGDEGEGQGSGFTVNLPVPPGSGDETWVSLVAHVVRPLARAYAPQLVLVSAGYDAHADDTIASCRVSDGGFAAMTAHARALAEEAGAPLALVLEGGYDLDALGRSFTASLEVLGEPSVPEAPDLQVHPLAADALRRLVPRWGDLSS